MAITGSKPNKVTVDGTTVTIKAGSGIPGAKGDTGSQGPAGTAATVTVGTTTTGAPGTDASVVNSGTSSAAVLEFTVPRGAAGAAGVAATITVGSTTTGTAGSTAVVTNSGTSSAAVLDFTIPRGDQGVQGPTGAAGPAGSAATVTVGSTTTGTAGSTALVTNSGSSSAAVLNFTIPRGDKGDTGNTGATGATGASGQWDTAQTISAKTDSYTLLTADAGKLVTFDKATAVNCTVDGSLDLSAGQRIDILQLGAGQVTVVASSATVNGTPGLKLRARYSAATILCVATDTYVVLGDLAA